VWNHDPRFNSPFMVKSVSTKVDEIAGVTVIPSLRDFRLPPRWTLSRSFTLLGCCLNTLVFAYQSTPRNIPEHQRPPYVPNAFAVMRRFKCLLGAISLGAYGWDLCFMRGLYLCDVTDYQLPRSAFEKMTSIEIILCFIIKCTDLFGGCFCRQRCMFQTGEWKVSSFCYCVTKEINLFPNIDQIKYKLFKSTVSFSEIIQHKWYMCMKATFVRDIINRRILRQGNYTCIHILMKLVTLLVLEFLG
jgi:hypothetical protein